MTHLFQLEPVIEEDHENRKEKKKKHKRKKKKKHRDEEREELIEQKETNIDQNLNNANLEQQWNTINLPPNIPSEPSKPSAMPKFGRTNSERGLLPKFKPPEDSDTGTDNAVQGMMKPSQRVSGLSMSGTRTSGEFSPRSLSWRPGTRIKDDTSDDDKESRRKSTKSPGRAKFSNEVIDIRDVSSDDSEENTRHSFQKLKKKKKKRHWRNLSDSDDI